MADTSSKTLVLWDWHAGTEPIIKVLNKKQNIVNRNSVAKYAFSSATPKWTLLSTHKWNTTIPSSKTEGKINET